MQTAEPTIHDHVKEARSLARQAELAIRIAARGAIWNDDATPAWIVLTDLIEAQTKIHERLALLSDLLKNEGKSEREAWEAGAKLGHDYGDNYVHFDGDQKERQWSRFLATKGVHNEG